MQNQSILPLVAEEHFKKLPEQFPIFFLETSLLETSVGCLHSHDFLEIGICLEGSGVFMFRDKIMPFSKGDVTIFPHGVHHQASSNRKVRSNWVFIFFDPPSLLSTCCDNPELLSTSPMRRNCFPFVFNAKKYSSISSLASRLVAINNEKRDWADMEIKAVLVQLLIEINRSAGYCRKGDDESPQLESSDVINRIAPALNYIASNYKSPLKIIKLAKLCCVSVETLRRLFKRSVGRSPENYIQHVRIQIAASLLENSQDPICDISMRAGFQTLSCFNRQFLKIMTVSPRNWRKKVRLK